VACVLSNSLSWLATYVALIASRFHDLSVSSVTAFEGRCTCQQNGEQNQRRPAKLMKTNKLRLFTVADPVLPSRIEIRKLPEVFARNLIRKECVTLASHSDKEGNPVSCLQVFPLAVPTGQGASRPIHNRLLC